MMVIISRLNMLDVLQGQIKELTATSTRTEKLALSLVYEPVSYTHLTLPTNREV